MSTSRKDGKYIAKRLRAESSQKVEPAHGNVISVLCHWLDDGNSTRAANGLAAAIKYDNVHVLKGTLERPQAIGLPGQQKEPTAEHKLTIVSRALNKLGEQTGSKTLYVESFRHLGELLDLEMDEGTLEDAIIGMEGQDALVLCRRVWPWELLFLDTPEAA